MKEAIIAGLISGLISPTILSWFQHRLIWKKQKRLDIKFNIFTDAVTALSSLETDSTNPNLQKNKSTYKGMTRAVELRPATEELIEKSRGMVKAFYAEETYNKFDKALKSKISIENIPNIEFEEKRVSAIVGMARELGIGNQNVWQSLTDCFNRRLRKRGS
jgi:hypothetical protein